MTSVITCSMGAGALESQCSNVLVIVFIFET